MTWNSKTPLSEVEGYILAKCLRMQAGLEGGGKAQFVIAPSVLTADKVGKVVGPFAYFRRLAIEYGAVGKAGADVVFRGYNDARFDEWVAGNEKEIEAAAAKLEIVAAAGFSCYEGSWSTSSSE